MAAALISQAPSIAAGGLLFPWRTTSKIAAPPGCVDRVFAGEDVTLNGWECGAGAPRPTVIYLHGIADNQSSAAGAIDHFTSRGFGVIAYDSRRHGTSGGDVCTYGFLEKLDLRRVIDALSARPSSMVGTSLEAAECTPVASSRRWPGPKTAYAAARRRPQPVAGSAARMDRHRRLDRACAGQRRAPAVLISLDEPHDLTTDGSSSDSRRRVRCAR